MDATDLMTIIMMIILMMIFVDDVTWSNSEVEAMKRMLVTDSKHWKKNLENDLVWKNVNFGRQVCSQR